MVTVISRPLQHKLDLSLNDGAITNSSGDALVTTMVSHGLTTGGYVYIESNIETYNGFKEVDIISPVTFKIKENLLDYTPFRQNADISFQKSLMEHGYQSVHLPIVYELHSDKFPNNELDETYAPRTITGFSNQNGYTVLDLSVDIYDPHKLSFIILKGTGPLAGPYQIVNFVDANSPGINLAYKSTNDFSPYVVEQYYNNYYIGVNIWGGLSSGHRWETDKPMELMATLKQIPDSNGNIRFSISEIIKAKIQVRNNLTLDTLPNNLDFFTEFYIEYFESYDVTDNTTISTFVGDTTTDSFIGQGINSDMPFKSVDSGGMSDYISSGDSLGQWLILQERPFAVVGFFFDMSFINTENLVDILVTILKKYQGYTFATEVTTIENPGRGVIRFPIDAQMGYDEYCIQARTPDSTVEITIPPSEFDLSTFTQGGGGGSWVISAHPTYYSFDSGLGTGAASMFLGTPFPTVNGTDYLFSFDITTYAPNMLLYFALINDDLSGAIVQSEGYYTVPGNYSGSFTIHSSGRTRFGIGIDSNFTNANNIRINSITHGTETTETITIPGVVLTEQICIDILEECATFSDGNARLTESGDIRIIE
jgi:hypothetical protein